MLEEEKEIIDFFRNKTIQDLKKYYQVKNFEIENIKDDIEEIDYKLTGISAVDYSKERIKAVGYKEDYRKEELIIKKIDLQLKLLDLKTFINSMEFILDQLGKKEKEILINTYGANKVDKLPKGKLAKKLRLKNYEINDIAETTLTELMYLNHSEIYYFLE